MTTYGYIRNSRSLESGHARSDPEAQCQQLLRAGVDPLHIYSDVSSFRTKGALSRNQWRALNQSLALGDVLVVVAIDRISRRYLDTMWVIYDLHRRGVRLRSLADNEGEWTAYLDVDRGSTEASVGNILASMAGYVASQEGRAISARTKAGLDKARAEGKRLGRPSRITGDQLTEIRRELADNLSMSAISRKYGIPRSTLRDALERTVSPRLEESSHLKKDANVIWNTRLSQDLP